MPPTVILPLWISQNREASLATTFEYLKEYGWGDENVSYEGTYTNEFAQVAADTLGMTDPEAK